ncbi:MAG: hypothetical protein ABIV28_02060 [Longimicrobiales bacterium]
MAASQFRHSIVIACAIAFALSARLPVSAQKSVYSGAIPEPDPRVIKDSLSRITVRRAVRDIEQQHARSGTIGGLLAAGFAALRSWELSHLAEDAKNARRHFERAREIDPSSPWPLYGWAAAMMPLIKDTDDPGRLGFTGDNALVEDLGLDPRSRARRALEKAVAIDPTNVDAVRLLGRLGVETRDEQAIAQATAALKTLAANSPDDPAAFIALADAALASGDLETAASSAKAAATIARGTLLAHAHHIAARALLRMPGREAEGQQEYFNGLRDMSREETARYFDELRGIATTSEMAQIERLPFVQAPSWIQVFWDMHAAMSGVTVSHRLAAHFKRLPHAEAYFRREQHFGAPTRNALLLDRPESPFDDRGVIFLRHGEPDDVVRSRNTESWVYMNLGGRPEMYHFTDGAAEGPQGFNDWYLMYNLPCDSDFIGARAQYDNRLAKLMHHCDDPLTIREVSALVRRDVREALATDMDRIGFTRLLAATYDIYTFRGEKGWTDVVATIGVQASRMKPLTLENGDKLYAVNASLIVIDTAARDVARKDTVIEAKAETIANRGSVVLGDVSLSTLPAAGIVHRVMVADAYDETHGQLYGGPLKVQDYSGSNLMISDVVLAAPDRGGSFNRGAVSLSLVPWQAFSRGEFRVFYELYNVSPGHPYTTELKLESIKGGVSGAVSGLLGRRPAVSLRFEDVAPASSLVIQQVRDAQASPEPGEYRLTITITDGRTGQKVSRSRPVTVIR